MPKPVNPDYQSPYKMPAAPLRLKGLILECDIKQGALAQITGIARKGWTRLVRAIVATEVVRDGEKVGKKTAFFRGPRAG